MTNGVWRPVGPADEGDDRWVGHDASDRFPVYTRGNAGEVYPEVFTPLSFSVAAEAAERAMRQGILQTGLIRPQELSDLPLTTAVGSGVFGGYAYLNLSIQRLAAARVPGGKATDADTNYLGVGEPPPHIPDPNEKNRRASLAGLRYIWRLLKVTDVPELADDRRRADQYVAGLPDRATATDQELRETVLELIPLFAELFERHIAVTVDAGTALTVLSGICERRLDDPLLATRLLAGLGDVDSAAPSAAMWSLGRMVRDSETLTGVFDEGTEGLGDRLSARADQSDPEATQFMAHFDDLIKRYGSRGPNEWDTAFDTWETDPSLALVLIDRLRLADDDHDPSAQQVRLAREAAELEADCLTRLKGLDRWVFRRALRAARVLSRARERSKTTVIQAIHGARLQSMALDERLVARSGGQRGDLWFLLDPELDAYLDDPASMIDTIAERRHQHQRLTERIPPFFFSDSQPPLDDWERRDTELSQLAPGAELTGLPGCPGVARGRARVVLHPSDPRGLAPGDVLVAPLTDPAWTPLFLAAEAVVVDVGAVMSHAVIVSRELGIPCVVSATDASRRIPDGAIVEVDGNAGTVTVVEP